jgi:hypothetical protein
MAVSLSSPFQIRVKTASTVTQPANDVWTNLGTSVDGDSWFYSKPVVRKDNGSVLIPGFGGRTKVFDPATRMFTAIAPSGWGSTENFDICHDSANARFWVTGQAPSAFPGPGNAFRFAASVPGAPSVTSAVGHLAGANSACGVALGKLISFGGFSRGLDTFLVTDLSTLVVNVYKATGLIPPILRPNIAGSPCERVCGVDSRTGQAWFVGADAELYVCNGILDGTPKWSLIPTFGQAKPTFTSIVFCLIESANSLVGWCGLNRWNTDQPPGSPDIVRAAWALDLGTLAWRQVGTTGGPPPAEVAAYNALLYDPLRQRAILCVSGSGTGTRVWALQLQGPQV